MGQGDLVPELQEPGLKMERAAESQEDSSHETFMQVPTVLGDRREKVSHRGGEVHP